MSAILVNVDPEILSRLAAFAGANCDELIEAGNFSGAIAALLAQATTVFGADNVSDIEGFFVAIIYCIDTLCAANSVQEVSRVIAAINGVSSADASVKLNILVSMFNTSNDDKCRFALIQAVLAFALESSQCGQVHKFHQYVDAWVKAWKLNVTEQRQLFKLMAEVLAARGAGVTSSSATDSANTTMNFFSKYLSTFADASEKLAGAQLDDYSKLATSAAVHAIQSTPSAHRQRGDIYRALAAHKHVKASVELASLTELLSIVCDGSLTKFTAFVAKNSGLMTTHKLSVEKVTHTVKLLTVCAAVEAENSANSATVSYNSIIGSVKAKTDGSFDASDVEYWIVETIANDLINATINQCDCTVTIRSCAVTQPQSVASIRSKLANISSSVRASVSTIGAPSN